VRFDAGCHIYGAGNCRRQTLPEAPLPFAALLRRPSTVDDQRHVGLSPSSTEPPQFGRNAILDEATIELLFALRRDIARQRNVLRWAPQLEVSLEASYDVVAGRTPLPNMIARHLRRMEVAEAEMQQGVRQHPEPLVGLSTPSWMTVNVSIGGNESPAMLRVVISFGTHDIRHVQEWLEEWMPVYLTNCVQEAFIRGVRPPVGPFAPS
jgi:hypothetical protein